MSALTWSEAFALAPGHLVVVNAEGRHSLWSAGQDLPQGWSAVAGSEGTREQCLETIDRLWPDIRPLSMRAAATDPGAARIG